MTLTLNNIRLLFSNHSRIGVSILGTRGKKKSSQSNDLWDEMVASYGKSEEKPVKKNFSKSDVTRSTRTTHMPKPKPAYQREYKWEKEFDNATKSQKAEEEIEDKDQISWFKNLTTTKSASELGNQEMISTREKLASCKTEEERREMIKQMVDVVLVNNVALPSELTEGEMDFLLTCSSFSQVKKAMTRIAKERFYDLQKQERRKIYEAKLAERKARIDAGEEIEEKGNNYIHRPVNLMDEKYVFRNRLASAIVNNNPSFVFDFRYEHYFHRANLMPSLYRQYAEIIKMNRTAPNPFQIHFCNYNSESVFHQKYAHHLELDKNLIQETSKSYMDIFPREKLVYLSKDSRKKLTHFDPEKVYIIGNIIDSGNESDQYASYTQAKKDNIECLRLPIDENIRWVSGTKNLAMHHVFELLLKNSQGMPWYKAFNRVLPSRFTSEKGWKRDMPSNNSGNQRSSFGHSNKYKRNSNY